MRPFVRHIYLWGLVYATRLLQYFLLQCQTGSQIAQWTSGRSWSGQEPHDLASPFF